MSSVDDFYKQDDNYNENSSSLKISRNTIPENSSIRAKPKPQPTQIANYEKTAGSSFRQSQALAQELSYRQSQGQTTTVPSSYRPPITAITTTDPSFQTTRPNNSNESSSFRKNNKSYPPSTNIQQYYEEVEQQHSNTNQPMETSSSSTSTYNNNNNSNNNKRSESPGTKNKTQIAPEPINDRINQNQLGYISEQPTTSMDVSNQDNNNNDNDKIPDNDKNTKKKNKSKSKAKLRTSFSPDANTEDGNVNDTDNDNNINNTAAGISQVQMAKKRKSMSYSVRSFYSTYSEQTISPTANFRDHIFDCFKNLWPSCGCVTLGGYSGCILPMFMAAQISGRIDLFDPSTVFLSYCILQIVFFIIAFASSLAHTNGITDGTQLAVAQEEANMYFYCLFFTPSFAAILFLIYLRLMFVVKFQINEDWITSICTGLLCSGCSLCQMARHLWDYKHVFDGDGRMDGYMQYYEDDGAGGGGRSRAGSVMSVMSEGDAESKV